MRMDFDSLNEIQHNETVRKRLAKLMAHDCFRNTKLEDFHSGKYPSSKTGDYSDVKVVSPFGEIPSKELSRLSDEEMKILMIDVVNQTYTDATSSIPIAAHIAMSKSDPTLAAVTTSAPAPAATQSTSLPATSTTTAPISLDNASTASDTTVATATAATSSTQ